MDPLALQNVDAIVHLAGAGIAENVGLPLEKGNYRLKS